MAIQTSFLSAPAPETVAELERAYDLPKGLVDHALDDNELPRLEKDRDATLVILRVPIANDAAGEPPFLTVPVGVLIRGERVWVLCHRANALVDSVARAAPAGTERPAHLILRLVLATAEAFLEHLGTLTRNIDALEDRVTRATSNAEVLGLLRQQKSLVFFATALQANELLLERLRLDPLLDVEAGDHDLLEDAAVELRQALAVTRLNSDILSNTMDAFASIISNNLNVVMKLLTALTIVISIPTLVASLYGMNVALPGAGSALAFGVVTGASILGAAVVAVAFWKKGWM